MTSTVTKDRTARWHRYWDKQSRTYDRQMAFFDRHLLGDSRTWACGQATGTVLEVAVGTGLNLEQVQRFKLGLLERLVARKPATGANSS